MTAAYLDSSAFVKLVTDEAESPALRDFLAGGNPSGEKLRLVASDLTYAESVRAAKRHSEAATAKTFELFEAFFLLPVSSSTYRRAALLSPPALRTLDALHVSAALEMPRSSLGIVCYDTRLIDAARSAGLFAYSPS